MAASALSDWIVLAPFPPGRAVVALERVEARARNAQQEAVAQAARRGLEEARRLVALEERWAAQRAGRPDPALEEAETRASRIDARIDRVLAHLARLLESLRALHGAADEARGKPAARLLDGLFPYGVFAITSLSFPEQLEAVRRILDGMCNAWADDVEALGLGAIRHELTDLLSGFADALDAGDASEVLRLEDLQVARTRCQDALLAVVATILGAFPYGDAHHIERRTHLLQPIEQQRDDLARAQRRGRVALVPES